MAFVILTLAIGIGANTGVFSVVNALLLRSLPFRDPERLVALHAFFEPHDSPQQFHEWRRQSAYLADAALLEQGDVNVGGSGDWRRVHVAQVTWNFFSLLGTQPALGRAFAAGEDVAAPFLVGEAGSTGPDAVAVIGYGLWQEELGGNPGALGSTIRLNGWPLKIIGVAPPGFDYPGGAVLWKPARMAQGNNGWETVARLKAGISWTQAREQFTAEAEWPNRMPTDRLRFPSLMTGLQDDLAGPTRNGSLVLMACVAAILLIACVNLANLLTAQTVDRTAEFSIRSALGASRKRLIQQLLSECLLLSLAGAIAGLFVAYWTTVVAAKLQPAPLMAQAYSLLDGRVVGFAIVLSMASALLVGLLPAWYAGRMHLFGSRGSVRGTRLIREGLVAAQVALTIVLTAAALTTGEAFTRLMQGDRGFDVRGVVTVNVAMEGTRLRTAAERLGYMQQVLEQVRRMRGVRSASATESLPLYSFGSIGGRLQMEGRRAIENSKVVFVMPDYFRSMGGQVLRGREFTDADMQSDARVAVVSERCALAVGAGAEAIGREVSFGGSGHWRIVGVVKGMDYMVEGAEANQLMVRANANTASANEIFLPSRSPGAATIVARVNGRAEDHLGMVRDAVRSVDPQVPVFDVKTMEQRMDGAVARPLFYRTAVVCFAGFAFLLALIGIYGIVSYAVSRRMHELGVRLALGSTPSALRARLVRQGLVTIGAGVIPGIAGSVFAGRFIQILVDGATPVNAMDYAALVVGIASAGAVGIWMASRSVARVDVVEVLRAE
jgi:putative ABC transport system permease protein